VWNRRSGLARDARKRRPADRWRDRSAWQAQEVCKDARADGAGAFGVELAAIGRSEEHTSELQSRENLVCRLLLEKKKQKTMKKYMICTLLVEITHSRKVENDSLRG